MVPHGVCGDDLSRTISLPFGMFRGLLHSLPSAWSFTGTFGRYIFRAHDHSCDQLSFALGKEHLLIVGITTQAMSVDSNDGENRQRTVSIATTKCLHVLTCNLLVLSLYTMIYTL